MFVAPLYLPGDPVFYVGEKYKDRLNGKKGWIHAPVVGNSNAWVVEFPDTRNSKDQKDTDDYIMSGDVLSKWRPSPAELKKMEGPEIQPRRHRGNPEDE
jgi:hypothetical protein